MKVLVILFIFTICNANLFADEANIVIELDLEKSQYEYFEFIFVKVNIKNQNSYNIELLKDPFVAGPTIDFVIYDDEEKLCDTPKIYVDLTDPSPIIEISPGTQVHFPIDGQYYNLLKYMSYKEGSDFYPGFKEGQYRIKGTLIYNGQKVESEWYEFTVKPADRLNYNKFLTISKKRKTANLHNSVDSLSWNLIEDTLTSNVKLRAILDLFYTYFYESEKFENMDIKSRFEKLFKSSEDIFLTEMPDSRFSYYVLVKMMGAYARNDNQFDRHNYWSKIAKKIDNRDINEKILMRLGQFKQNGVQLIKQDYKNLQQ